MYLPALPQLIAGPLSDRLGLALAAVAGLVTLLVLTGPARRTARA